MGGYKRKLRGCERKKKRDYKRKKEWRKEKEGMEAKLNADITKLRKQNKESELKMKEREDAHIKNEENRKSKQEFFRKQQEEEDANECIRKAFAGFHEKELKSSKEGPKGDDKEKDRPP